MRPLPRTLFRSSMVAAWMILSLGRAPGATPQDDVVEVHLEPATTIGKIPGDFLGFGYETSAVAQPDFFSDKNARMIGLYSNLGRHGLIRIGGNVSDHTRFIPNSPATARTERDVTIINRASLVGLGEFARTTGWNVMWGLNLGTGTKEQAAEEAVAVDQALGASLQSFQIGNEVDLMRRYSKNFDAYHAAFIEYKTAIRAKLPQAAFSGPDAAGSLGFVEKFVATESSDMKLATYHYYRGYQGDPKSTMDRLLTGDEPFDARLRQLQNLCAARHLDYRINEVNSFSGGGKEGVSDTFGSALWCLDYLFRLASHGCGGVNLETDINQLGFVSFYSPIAHDAHGVCIARPEYYGMLAFAMAGRGEIIKASLAKTDVNLTTYATRDDHGAIFMALINKDLTRDATIKCTLPDGYKSAEAHRLRGPSADAKTDVTFAGSAVAEDGKWLPGPAEAVTASAGVLRLPLPHASAAVLKLNR